MRKVLSEGVGGGLNVGDPVVEGEDDLAFADIEIEFSERALIDLPAVVVIFEELVTEIFNRLLDGQRCLLGAGSVATLRSEWRGACREA